MQGPSCSTIAVSPSQLLTSPEPLVASETPGGVAGLKPSFVGGRRSRYSLRKISFQFGAS